MERFMPTYRTGDMWDSYGDGLFLITTNSYLRRDGCLVMGRGIALQTKEKFPEIPKTFGKVIKDSVGSLGQYGLIVLSDLTLGAFQVKKHFKDKASPELIKHSVRCLNHLLTQHPEMKVNLNFPGIGWGHLKKEEVSPILEDLPDQVNVWTYK